MKEEGSGNRGEKETGGTGGKEKTSLGPEILSHLCLHFDLLLKTSKLNVVN